MHDAGRTEKNPWVSKVLDRKLNLLEAQMVFSALLSDSWDIGRDREILDVNTWLGRWWWWIGLANSSRLMDSYPQKEKEEEKKEEEENTDFF